MTSIVGTWKLHSIELKNESGKTAYPFGKNVKGLVLYQYDGYMAGIISGENRPNVSSPALVGIAEHECAAIAKHFNAYAGRYRVQGKRIVHNVEISFVPNLMAVKEHVSVFSLAGETLTLSSKITSEVQATFNDVIVTWKKARPSHNDR